MRRYFSFIPSQNAPRAVYTDLAPDRRAQQPDWVRLKPFCNHVEAVQRGSSIKNITKRNEDPCGLRRLTQIIAKEKHEAKLLSLPNNIEDSFLYTKFRACIQAVFITSVCAIEQS